MASMVNRSPLLGGSALVAYAAALVVLCVGTWQILLARDAAVLDAEANTRNLTQSLAQHAARSVEAVDLILSGVIERIEAGSLADPGRFGHFLAWRAGMIPQVLDIVVTDADGDLIAASIAAPHPARQAADRSDLAWHRANADRGLRIEAPNEGRGADAPIIPLSRRWNRPDGTFGGVVFAALRPDYFQGFYDRLGIGTQGSIGLFSLTGRVLARHPVIAGVLGRDISDGPLFRDRLPAAPAGTFASLSPIDGVRRIAAYERVKGYPLVVYVGRSVDEVLAPWRRDALTEAAILGLAGAGLIGLGIGLGRDQKRAAAAEAAVRTSEARYRMLAETTTDVITRLDLAFKRTYVSPTCRALFGYEPEAMLGDQPSATIHADDAPAVRALARLLAAGGIAGDRATTTYRTRHKLGHEIWVEAGMRLVRDAAGLPESIVCTLRDVTERRRTESALEASEARYRLLSENATDMVTQMDLTGRRLYVSPASRELLGYEPGELVGTRPQDAIHPDDAEGLGALLGALAAGACERGVHVNRLRHRDGRWIWVEASLKRLQGDDGRTTGFVASLRNITERRTTDEALRESEARYRMLADNTSDVIMLRALDPLGGRSYVSPAVRAMLGYEPEAFAEIPIADLVHPDDYEATMARYGALGPETPYALSVHRLRHRNGSYVWVEIIFRLLTDTSDGQPRVLGAIRDVTERQRQAHHLEQAKLAAEAGMRVKAEFLANMSHELRTPLTGMLGVHDLLRSDPRLDEGQRHLVGLAQTSGRALLRIVNDILDFSKIEAGHLAIEHVPFDLHDLVETVRALTIEAAQGRPVTVSASVEGVPPWLLGDPTRLRQVLTNLAGNAVKFTPSGSVALRVRRVAEPHRADRLGIEVCDTGIGISGEALGRLFERFSQADGSTARRFGGTGLGLAISRRLVELMGGEIAVRSVEGEGSTFSVLLPLAPVGMRAADAPRDALAGPAGHGLRILLAEDNAINQTVIAAVLERKGHAVAICGNGREAVEAVCREAESQEAAGQEAAFDVVLMDVQMPELDGLAATAAIRAWENGGARPPIPIVALTANAMPEEVERCRSAGTSAHVGKPIDWPVLFATLDRLVPSGRGDADAQRSRRRG